MAESLTRRDLFTFWRTFAGEPAPPPQPARNLLPDYLRPPGAVDEAEFASVCERCHKCQEACPHDVILPLGPAYGKDEGTPAILPRGGPCRLCDDLPCAVACPSGALKPIPITAVRMGTARLNPAACWAVQGQPCDYCVKECPLGDRAIRWNGDRPEIVEEGCTGCGMCVYICTADPPALRIEGPDRTT
jgi:ferredoxin-type protein NapG